MDMLEKIARVLADQTENGSENFWEHHVYDARAVLTALLEPTPEMIEAGAGIMIDWDYLRDEIDPVLTRSFQAMIRKALGE